MNIWTFHLLTSEPMKTLTEKKQLTDECLRWRTPAYVFIRILSESSPRCIIRKVCLKRDECVKLTESLIEVEKFDVDAVRTEGFQYSLNTPDKKDGVSRFYFNLVKTAKLKQEVKNLSMKKTITWISFATQKLKNLQTLYQPRSWE